MYHNSKDKGRVEKMEANQIQKSNSERIAALEATYQHLATKADIERLRADFESLRSEVKALRWYIVVSIGVVGVVVQILNQSGG